MLRFFSLLVYASVVVVGLDSLPVDSSSLSGSRVSAAWYAGWHVADLPLEEVSWSKYTIMYYAFALTTPDPSLISVVESDQILLPQFVAAAHKHNVQASLSIGGWTGSRWFSASVGSAQNRTAFVKSIAALVKRYKLDGIDFDWEYPGVQGIGCNLVNSDDTANFLLFLQELRTTVGPSLTISAATDVTPLVDSSGAPSTDVSEFSKVLDYIIMMNYDIKSTPETGAGPNAPLDDSCAPSGGQRGSATSGVNAWTKAGMPTNQIVLGVPAYGRSYRVPQSVAFSDSASSTLASYPTYDLNDKPLGDRWNGEGGLDVCGHYQDPGGTYAFRNLVEEDFLEPNGSVKDGISYRYDNCSETPFVYNPQTNVLVTFDNSQSFASKGSYIKSAGLKGFAIWEAAGDLNNILLNAILNGTINGASRTIRESPQPSATTSSSSSATHIYPSCFLRDLSTTLGVLMLFSLLFYGSIPF